MSNRALIEGIHCDALLLIVTRQVCRELNGAVLKFTTREQPVRERLWQDMDEGKFTQGET